MGNEVPTCKPATLEEGKNGSGGELAEPAVAEPRALGAGGWRPSGRVAPGPWYCHHLETGPIDEVGEYT